MDQSIATLSPEQAQRALIVFYDLLPADAWEGGTKPSAAKLESAAERLQDDAPDDVRPVLDTLLAEGNEQEKGEMAKAVLAAFHEQGALRDYVERAVEQARQPHMAPIPLIVGAVIIILAALPKEVDLKEKKWTFGHLDQLATVVKAIGDVAAKVPAEVWKNLFAKGGQ